MATMVGTQASTIDLLNQLIELDFDAVEAYRAALARLQHDSDKTQLKNFLEDHERHVIELSGLVVRLGATPPSGPDLKQVLTKGKVLIGSLLGDRAILMAMKTNEDDTNTAYQRAVSRTFLSIEIRTVLSHNLDDERRHRAWIEQRLATRGASAHR